MSEEELDTAISFAKERYGVDVSREVLQILMNQIADRRARTKENFHEARAAVLVLYLPQRDKNEKARRDAYSAACGKIGNIRRQRSDASRRQAATRREQRIAVFEEPSGQYAFVLSNPTT